MGKRGKLRHHQKSIMGKVTIERIRGKFIEKLKMTKEERKTLDIIPMSLIRKYITYARKYVKPVLTEEAGKILQEYYLELREHSISSTPITIRQLESLIRSFKLNLFIIIIY